MLGMLIREKELRIATSVLVINMGPGARAGHFP